MKTAAIYTRVSSEGQKENKTIGSQVDELIQFAREQGYDVPEPYIFKDEGYSGAILIRPGLEKVRDLSAEGQLHAVLIHSPDRLSRNYAYQVVLVDEFHANGVEVLFVNSPKADTPEHALLLQFQGMISEYERAMITERSRRGKRFKAKSGVVNVLGGAPYGYTYIKKTDESAASYEINEEEALIVQEIFRMYTEDFCSIGASLEQLIKELNPILQGWLNYFHYARMKCRMQKLMGWLRPRVRCFRLKQCKRAIGISRFLISLDVPEWRSWLLALSSKGWYHKSNTPQSHEAMNLDWFNGVGLRPL